MAGIGQKLETKGVIMTLLSLVLISTGCEERIDHPAVNPSEGKTVEVTLNIGFADEVDGYTLSAPSETKAATSAFSYELQRSTATKTATAKPEKLYNLEIVQYDSNGTYKKRAYFSGETAIGSTLNLTLDELSDCQLVIVAWGNGNTTTLGTRNLSNAQTDVSIDASVIKDIPVDNMNTMPYVLHLEHVCVESNTIKSIDGKDVRLLLRRLATRLTLDWTYSYSGYQLKQILLQSIPLNYKVVAAPDKDDKTYPSLLDQFTTIQLTDSQITAGNYSCWIPANVRGSNPAATSQRYRIKSNAPTGSSYVDFIAANTSESKKKLSYRVYLGGTESTDFNLYGNTDYTYTVKIDHTGLPVNDRRVTIIDPIAASENNNNLVPTANCFMVAPGGAFCFDPFIYQQNGTEIDNSTLQGWSDTEGGIAYVKLLWQTKENGDVGDPVMGVVNSTDDHTNIVDIKRIDGSSLPTTGKGQARIYCRVAPNTSGGSGLIAAYTASKEIIWSWHVWVTDYNPDPTGNENILEPDSKRKQKYAKAGVDDQLPMMDRNLGAMAGFVTLPTDPVDMSKACGFHYQGGRKDPFPSSYSSSVRYSIDFSANDKTPPLGMLNQYGPDGITYFPHQGNNSNTAGEYRALYKSPYQLFNKIGTTEWNTTLKNEHDPCPAGWRMPKVENYKALFEGDEYISTNVDGRYQARGYSGNMVEFLDNGNGNGYLLYYDDTHRSYFRMTGYPPYYYQFRYIGTCGNVRTREINKGFTFGNSVVNSSFHSFCIGTTWGKNDAHTTRCIQECK